MHDIAAKFSRVGVSLQMPPASNATLGPYWDIDVGKMLAAEAKFDAKFSNPMHEFQGGLADKVASSLDIVCSPPWRRTPG